MPRIEEFETKMSGRLEFGLGAGEYVVQIEQDDECCEGLVARLFAQCVGLVYSRLRVYE